MARVVFAQLRDPPGRPVGVGLSRRRGLLQRRQARLALTQKAPQNRVGKPRFAGRLTRIARSASNRGHGLIDNDGRWAHRVQQLHQRGVQDRGQWRRDGALGQLGKNGPCGSESANARIRHVADGCMRVRWKRPLVQDLSQCVGQPGSRLHPLQRDCRSRHLLREGRAQAWSGPQSGLAGRSSKVPEAMG